MKNAQITVMCLAICSIYLCRYMYQRPEQYFNCILQVVLFENVFRPFLFYIAAVQRGYTHFQIKLVTVEISLGMSVHDIN